jgi:hypothetical protein
VAYDHVPQHRRVELEIELRGVAGHVERVRGEADPGRAQLLVPKVGLVGAKGEEQAEHAAAQGKGRTCESQIGSNDGSERDRRFEPVRPGFERSASYPNSECTIGGAHSWYRNEASVMQLAHSVCAISIGSTRRATWKGSLLELRMGWSTISHCR